MFGLTQTASAVAALTVVGRDMIGTKQETLSSPDVQWIDEHTLRVEGSAISRVGTEARSREDDVSAPGMVLAVLS
jgi:hypothetical protein